MNIFARVKESVTVLQAVEHYGVEIQKTGCAAARFTMTVIRACMYRMTTTTVLPAGNTGT